MSIQGIEPMAKRITRRRRTRAADHEEETRKRSGSRHHAHAAGSGDAGEDGRHASDAPDHAAEAHAMGDHGDEAQSHEHEIELGLVGRMVYHSSYVLSYGAVYPFAFLAGLVPKENALVYGLVDGAADARDAAIKRRASLGSVAGEGRAALAGQPA
jgi:hypothetical protein